MSPIDHAAASVLERAEAAQQRQLFLAEAGDVGEGLGPREHRQQGQKQHLVERVDHLSGLPAIRQVIEMVQEPYGLENLAVVLCSSRPWLSPIKRIEDRHKFSTSAVCHVLLHPIALVREAIALVFRKFAELQTVRQALVWIRQQQIALPAIVQGSGVRPVEWKTPVYHTLHHVLTNPVYAGA